MCRWYFVYSCYFLAGLMIYALSQSWKQRCQQVIRRNQDCRHYLYLSLHRRRGNEKLAAELLAEQEHTLQEIYFPETLLPEEGTDVGQAGGKGLYSQGDGHLAGGDAVQRSIGGYGDGAPLEDEEKKQSATITVLASPEQARTITLLENDGIAHVAVSEDMGTGLTLAGSI